MKRADSATREPGAQEQSKSDRRPGARLPSSLEINSSPRMIAQRELLAAVFGPVGRRAAVEGSLQAKATDDGSAHWTERAPPKRNNHGLPDQLRAGIETLSGISMDRLKVTYNSDKPAQLNAHAYALGNEIHVAPGQERHLPHETWHVVQQAQGRVRPTLQTEGAAPINDDARLETEADVMGERALVEGAAQLTGSEDAGTHTTSGGLRSPIQGAVLQPKLKVNGVDLGIKDGGEEGELVQAATNIAWDTMMAALQQKIDETDNDQLLHDDLKALKAKLEAETLTYYVQLLKWMDDRPQPQKTYGKHPVFGRKQQNREYDNWIEVARALTGWVDAKPGRKLERQFAQEIYANPVQDAVLNSLAQKVRLKIESLKITQPLRYLEIINELKSDKTTVRALQGNVKQDATRYGHYEKEMAKAADEFQHPALRVRYATKLEILDAPANYTMRDKVILLHDITEYFGKHQPWNPVTAGQALIPIDNVNDAMVTTAVDQLGERTQSESAMTADKDKNKLARGMGKTTASRDENAPSTKLARKLNLPIWAGQSMTTVRLMNMAQWAGGQVHEMNALAQGIFAFWRLEYNHTSDFAYHTLHEVMDMAKNFGVEYKMHPEQGMQLAKMNEDFVRPAIQKLVLAMNVGYQSLQQEINTNTWSNQEFKQNAQINLQTLHQKVDFVNNWFRDLDFKAAPLQCTQSLTKVMQGLNLVRLDMQQLDSFIKLRSSTVGVGFWV